MLIPNVIENLHFRPSQSPGVEQSQLASISNTGDVAIVPTAGAFASVQNQVFNHVGYNIGDPKGRRFFPLSLIIANQLKHKL